MIENPSTKKVKIVRLEHLEALGWQGNAYISVHFLAMLLS